MVIDVSCAISSSAWANTATEAGEEDGVGGGSGDDTDVEEEEAEGSRD